jgi:hypothetical protein
MKRKLLIIVPAVIAGIAIGVGTAYAVPYTHFFWGTVNAWATRTDEIVIDAKSVGVLQDETFLYTDGVLAGMGSDYYLDPQAQIMLQRTSTDGTAKAWMKSSSGAKVSAEIDGDVIIDLGS